jgi:hypothetical protein
MVKPMEEREKAFILGSYSSAESRVSGLQGQAAQRDHPQISQIPQIKNLL